MIDITQKITSRVEVVNGSALVYLHLGKIVADRRERAIGYLSRHGFTPMNWLENKVSVLDDYFGWFIVKMDEDIYANWEWE